MTSGLEVPARAEVAQPPVSAPSRQPFGIRRACQSTQDQEPPISNKFMLRSAYGTCFSEYLVVARYLDVSDFLLLEMARTGSLSLPVAWSHLLTTTMKLVPSQQAAKISHFCLRVSQIPFQRWVLNAHIRSQGCDQR